MADPHQCQSIIESIAILLFIIYDDDLMMGIFPYSALSSLSITAGTHALTDLVRYSTGVVVVRHSLSHSLLSPIPIHFKPQINNKKKKEGRRRRRQRWWWWWW